MAYITSWYWNKGDFRKVNEDSFYAAASSCTQKELIFAAVCDGIGGLRAGECASGLVAEQLTEWFYREGFWKMRSLFWTKQMKKRALDALLDMQEKLERCEREEKICSGTTSNDGVCSRTQICTGASRGQQGVSALPQTLLKSGKTDRNQAAFTGS